MERGNNNKIETLGNKQNSMTKTIKKVKSTISRYSMIMHGDRVVVAVSGGPDSVCLLDMLHELKDDFGIELVAAHFDHGLRPGEDEAETRFVESLALSLNLPFETNKAGPHIKAGRGSLEERARGARYHFLEEVKGRFSAQKIAVGHNLNDQAETVLMRLLRGSGPSGLSGIPPCRDNKIIRPLIEISRNEILHYLGQRRLKYVTDSSNLETRYLRNRIRLELLPQLKKYQPRIIELLAQTSEIMRRDNGWLEVVAEEWVKEMAEITTDRQVLIPLSSFKELSGALRYRVIRYALGMTGENLRRVSLRHIEAISLLATGRKPQGRISLPNMLTAKRMYDKLIFARVRVKDRKFKGFCYSMDGPGTFHLKALKNTISLEETGKMSLPDMNNSPWTAFLNADHITYPLMIRSFRPGDKFVPLGMSGHKKLKDFFIDLKVPAEERACTPILTHKDMILWVCGFRIDDRIKVTPDTKKVLRVTFDELPGTT